MFHDAIVRRQALESSKRQGDDLLRGEPLPARGEVCEPGLTELEAVIELDLQIGQGQRAGLCGGDLEPEREAVERGADPLDPFGVIDAERELR